MNRLDPHFTRAIAAHVAQRRGETRIGETVRFKHPPCVTRKPLRPGAFCEVEGPTQFEFPETRGCDKDCKTRDDCELLSKRAGNIRGDIRGCETPEVESAADARAALAAGILIGGGAVGFVVLVIGMIWMVR